MIKSHTDPVGELGISGVGKKDDEGKLRWDLLPLKEIEDIVKIYTFGAEKYGDNTWQNLKGGYNRYKAAMFRHLMEFEKGNINDEESGLNHLAHMAWNAIAMLYLSKPKESVGDKIKKDVATCVNIMIDENTKLLDYINEIKQQLNFES